MKAKFINEIRKSRIPYIKGGHHYEEILSKIIELDKIIEETKMFGTTSHDLRNYWRWFKEGLPTGSGGSSIKWNKLDYEELLHAYDWAKYYFNNSVLDAHLFDKLNKI